MKMIPGGVSGSGAAPEGWEASITEDHCHWLTSVYDDQYMIPPGEWLSGFRFATDYDPSDTSFSYMIYMNRGHGEGGEFTPEYIPEPWLAGPLLLAALATREAFRRWRR